MDNEPYPQEAGAQPQQEWGDWADQQQPGAQADEAGDDLEELEKYFE